ncbi:hypothetical protein QTP88_014129 [Uroleucon formosanum]
MNELIFRVLQTVSSLLRNNHYETAMTWGRHLGFPDILLINTADESSLEHIILLQSIVVHDISI